MVRVKQKKGTVKFYWIPTIKERLDFFLSWRIKHFLRGFKKPIDITFELKGDKIK